MINCRNYFTYESRDKRIAVNGCGHINKSPPHKHKYFLSTGDPMINCILHQLFNDSCLDAQFFRNCSQFVARLKILLIQPTIYEVCHNLSIWNEVTVNLSDTEILKTPLSHRHKQIHPKQIPKQKRCRNRRPQANKTLKTTSPSTPLGKFIPKQKSTHKPKFSQPIFQPEARN